MTRVALRAVLPRKSSASRHDHGEAMPISPEGLPDLVGDCWA